MGKASAIRWHALFRAEGEIAAKPIGGDRHSHRIEAHAVLILQTLEEKSQAYLREVRATLQEHGAAVSPSGLSRFSKRHGISRKKGALHATERNRPDMMEARERWLEGQLALNPDQLVFLDETATIPRRFTPCAGYVSLRCLDEPRSGKQRIHTAVAHLP